MTSASRFSLLGPHENRHWPPGQDTEKRRVHNTKSNADRLENIRNIACLIIIIPHRYFKASQTRDGPKAGSQVERIFRRVEAEAVSKSMTKIH